MNGPGQHLLAIILWPPTEAWYVIIASARKLHISAHKRVCIYLPADRQLQKYYIISYFSFQPHLNRDLTSLEI
jgi:hypothetical protein